MTHQLPPRMPQLLAGCALPLEKTLPTSSLNGLLRASVPCVLKLRLPWPASRPGLSGPWRCVVPAGMSRLLETVTYQCLGKGHM